MQLLRIRFAETSTGQRLAMTQFVGQVLGRPQIKVDGVEADLFRLPDGGSFAIASPGGMRKSARSAS